MILVQVYKDPEVVVLSYECVIGYVERCKVSGHRGLRLRLLNHYICVLYIYIIMPRP